MALPSRIIKLNTWPNLLAVNQGFYVRPTNLLATQADPPTPEKQPLCHLLFLRTLTLLFISQCLKELCVIFSIRPFLCCIKYESEHQQNCP